MHRRVASLIVLAALAACPATAAAQDDVSPPPPRQSRVEWNPAWPKFRTWEYGVTAAGWAATIGSGYVLGDVPYGWQGRNDFDESTRDALRWSSSDARVRAAEVSDGLFYGLAAFPIVVDGLIVTAGVHRKPDVAFQLIMTDLESLGVAGLLAAVTERTGRERPFVRNCPSPDEFECNERGKYQSFISGHTAAAFAGASLICTHHTMLPLYGSRGADIATCSAAMGGAVVAGYLRIASDLHYTSDVLAAAGTGIASGFLLPYLLRFNAGPADGRRLAFAPFGVRDGVGLGMSGALP